MKGLFVVFHGFSAFSGISKKIFAQCEALGRCGIPTLLCHLEIAPDGTQRRMAGERVIRDFGRGIRAKLLKRLSFGDVTRYIRDEGIGMVYIRHDLNASPALILWLWRLRRMGVRTALEIPTYPYDGEFARASRKARMKLFFDRLFRRAMARYIDRIVTFSDETTIFGRPTIRISNGIDLEAVRVKERRRDAARELHLLAVANIHYWHGFDRAIEGLRHYYAAPRERIVRLRIAGDSRDALLNDYRHRIAQYGLTEYVALIGTRSGDALDAEFDWCDMGVASLGRHRNGITRIKTLKNREYAARGIPFVYSEQDADFDAMPYVMKAPADDTPLDIEALVRFYDTVQMPPAAIRASIADTLCWERQMGCVAEAMRALSEPKPRTNSTI